MTANVMVIRYLASPPRAQGRKSEGVSHLSLTHRGQGGSRPSDDGGSYATHRENLDVSDATFANPDLTTFCRLDELGLEVTGQRVEPGRAVLACRVIDDDRWWLTIDGVGLA